MGLQQAMFDAVLQGMNQLHKAVLAASGGRLMGTFNSMPVVEPHTVGRTTGRRRSVMLTSQVDQPDRVVLVASKGGDNRHTEWYRNLVANPDVEITAKGTTRPMSSRISTDEDRASFGRGSSRATAATATISGALTDRSPSSSSSHTDPTPRRQPHASEAGWYRSRAQPRSSVPPCR